MANLFCFGYLISESELEKRRYFSVSTVRVRGVDLVMVGGNNSEGNDLVGVEANNFRHPGCSWQ